MKERIIDTLFALGGGTLTVIALMAIASADSENTILPALLAIVPLAVLAIGVNLYSVDKGEW